MGYFKDIWSSLVFNAGSATMQVAGGLNWRYRDDEKDIKFVSNSAYKSVLAHVAKQVAASTLEGELNSLIPRYQKYVREKSVNAVRDKQIEHRESLIKNGEQLIKGFGFIECEGGHKLIAKTKYGTPVPEALMLWYDADGEPIQYEDVYWFEPPKDSNVVKKRSALERVWDPKNSIETTPQKGQTIGFKTRTVFHIDLAPRISMSSSKNLVLTQVQGRDFSRKELVSGGDMTYSVNGAIVSDIEGVYPAEAVKRFVKIMQYNGIINVNHFTFGLLGIKKIVIKDFNLDTPEYKNVQPYSFSCVAVEPDDAIVVGKDTIASLNLDLSKSQWDSWYKSILDKKLVQMATRSVINSAISAAGTGLDELTPNI